MDTQRLLTSDNVCNKVGKNYVKIDRLDRAGVYQINCDKCDALYIGKTERNIRQRFKEHLVRDNSNVYKHIKEKDHKIYSIDNNVKYCTILMIN